VTPDELREQLERTMHAVDRAAAASDRLREELERDRLRCVECGDHWNDPGERWRAYLTDDDPPSVVLFCPECAEHEFDGA